jgi:ankyrin repeat protein
VSGAYSVFLNAPRGLRLTHAQRSGGVTALLVASERGHADMVQFLLSRGANKEATNSGGWTPLMLAAASRRAEVVALLLARGANPDARNHVRRVTSLLARLLACDLTR